MEQHIRSKLDASILQIVIMNKQQQKKKNAMKLVMQKMEQGIGKAMDEAGERHRKDVVIDVSGGEEARYFNDSAPLSRNHSRNNVKKYISSDENETLATSNIVFNQVANSESSTNVLSPNSTLVKMKKQLKTVVEKKKGMRSKSGLTTQNNTGRYGSLVS